MKTTPFRLSIVVFWGASMLAADTPRNMIILFDWDKERITIDLKNPTFNPNEHGFGPPSSNLVTAIDQKAAPFIVTSSLWHNFVARRKMFKDFLEGKGATYLDKYPRFKNQQSIALFEKQVKAYFQPNGSAILGGFGGSVRQELDSYFLCYATFFEEKDWIIKKVSDYIYLFVPKQYSDSLQKDVFPSSQPNLKNSLSEGDLGLNLKLSKLKDMSYADALNPDKHALTLNKSNLNQLLRSKDFRIVSQLEQSVSVPDQAILSSHFIKLLPEIFLTQWDLVDKDNKADKTDEYRALYLRPWDLFLNGHGSSSVPGPVKEIIFQGRAFSISFAYQAGIELRAFREFLGFLDKSVLTHLLFYETCYSGGQHLQKLYEHEWDYPIKGGTVEARQDIFSYIIVAGNLAYTVTWSSMALIEPPYKQVSLSKVNIEPQVDFPGYFLASKKYFSISKVEVDQQKNYFQLRDQLTKEMQTLKSMMTGQPYPVAQWNRVRNAISKYETELEQLPFITLHGVIQYVHDVNQHQPAVRYPGADSFVALPIREKDQIAARIRFESPQAKAEREKLQKEAEEAAKKHFARKQPSTPQEPEKLQPQQPEQPKIAPKYPPKKPQQPVIPPKRVQPRKPSVPTQPADTQGLTKALVTLKQALQRVTQKLMPIRKS